MNRTTAKPARIARPALAGRLAVKTGHACTADRRGKACGAALFVIAEADRKTAAEAQNFCHAHGYQA